MWNIGNVNFNLIVVTEIGIKLTDFFNSILSGGAEEWRSGSPRGVWIYLAYGADISNISLHLLQRYSDDLVARFPVKMLTTFFSLSLRHHRRQLFRSMSAP
jgi:hypothetical protein